MPVPSPRNSIRVARGNFADLDANATAFGEGEFIYAIDQDRFYTSASGSLVPVGAGVVAAEGIDTLSDVDTSTIPPGVGQVLKWDGVNWIPADDNNTDAVTSVAGKTGDVTLIKADITDFSDADYATAAQGDTADTAVQPGDNVSDLTNDANYIDAAGAPIQSVNTQTGDVVLDADDIDDTLTTNKFATATQLGLADTSVQPGDNVSDLANDAGYITLAEVPSDVVTSVNTQTGDVVLDADDIDDTSTTHKFATAAQLGLADTSVQPGDNVSDLTNDANYIDASGAPVQSVNTQTGDVVLGAGDVGLGNVDNTSDANKPISTATQTALDAKADLVDGVIPTSQIPAIAITEFLGSVGSEAAMLALVGQQGDWCLRTDKAVGYVITGADPSLIANWEAFTVPGSAVTTINTQVGDVVLGAADVGAATAAQGALADSAVQPTDSIDVLADVDISTTAPTDGQALIWDNAGGKFVPGEAGLVDSVNTQTGDVVLNTDDIGEGTTNLYSQWDNATGGINYAGGFVGIGATDPQNLLHIQGDATFEPNAGGQLAIRGSTNPQNRLNIGFDTTSNYSFLQAITVGTAYRAIALNPDAGNVGIGTTAPDELLHIEGDAAEFKGTNTNSIDVSVGTEQVFKFGIEGQKNAVFGPTGSIIFRQDGSTWSFVEPNLKPTRIEFCTQDSTTTDTSETPRLVVDQNGLVGIGTTDPVSLLNVKSPLLNTAETVASFGNTTIPDGLEINTNGNLDWGFNAKNSRNLTFSTNQIERARIDTSGRLLVGTSTSQSVARNFGATSPSNIQVVLSSTFAAYSAICKKNDTSGPVLALASSRSDSIVNQDDRLGEIRFAGYDGTDYESSAALIKAEVDGTPGADDMPGRLVFSTTADGASTETERMRITSDAYVRLASGTGGIQFNGDTAAANALDDYEEGTFTPTISGTTTVGTATYTVQDGKYTKIGRLVNVQIYLNWSGGTGAGNLLVRSLPFTVLNTANSYFSASFGLVDNIALPANHYITGYARQNFTYIVVASSPTGGGAYSSVTYDAAGHFMLSCSYYT